MNQCRFIKETLVFWLHSSILALEKQPKKLNFQSFFTYNRPFGGYVQCNACTYFEKICSSTRYSQEKMIRNVSNFLVALPHFCFKKQPKNLSFQSITASNRPFAGYFQWNPWTKLQKIWCWNRYSEAKLIKNFSNFLVALLRCCFTKTT